MQFCILHKELPFSRFCLSCEQRVCSECATKYHTEDINCTVFPLESIPQEIKKRVGKLSVSLDSVDKEASAMSRECVEETETLSKGYSFVRAQIEKDYESLCKELKEERSAVTQRVIKLEISKEEQLVNSKLRSRQVQRAIESLANELGGVSFKEEPSDLVKLKEIENRIEGVEDSIKEIEENCMKEPDTLSLKRVFNNGVFGCLSLCTAIGSVIISPEQLVQVFDSRRENGGVLFICKNSKDHKIEFWRHLIKAEDDDCPVVISEKSIFCSKQQVLVAINKIVYSLRPHFNGLYDGIASFKAISLDDLKDDEWITSITSHQPSFDSSHEFLISVSNSSLLREYDMSGQPLRLVDIKDCKSSIRCVSYVYNMFAIIAKGIDDVMLFTAGNTVEVCGSLKAPACSHRRLVPKVVLWTGFRWLVLWISDGSEKEWTVVRYLATGEQTKICDGGVAHCDKEIPVSITRSRKCGYVSFRDGTFRSFHY